jgi:cytoskeletal protein RodZ
VSDPSDPTEPVVPPTEPVADQPSAGPPEQATPAGSAARPSSHRAPITAPPILARLLAPTTAVAVVVVVILLLVWINGRSPGHQPSTRSQQAAPTASATGGGTPTRSTRATAPASAGSSTSHTTAPPAAPSATPRHRPHQHPAAPPAPAHRHHSAPSSGAVSTAPVTVLNNSRRTGLAHAVAAELESKGWHIAFVGNLQGLVPVSSLYYAAGDAAAANHLAAEFSSVHRVQPNSLGNIVGSGLTLVVTADWVL